MPQKLTLPNLMIVIVVQAVADIAGFSRQA